MAPLHATTVFVDGDWGEARGIIAAAIPYLVLVDAEGLEQDPASILTSPVTDSSTTAVRAIDTSIATGGRGSVVIVHYGCATPQRAQGYIDVLSDVCSPGTGVTFQVEFDGQTIDAAPRTADQLRKNTRLRWAREGLESRPDGHRYRGLALLPLPRTDLRRKNLVEQSAGALLEKRFAIPRRTGESLYSDHGLSVAEYLAAQSMTGTPTNYRASAFVHANDGSVFAALTHGARGLTRTPRTYQSSVMVRPPSALSRPEGFGGGSVTIAHPDNTLAARPRKATEGRLIYLDSSALTAGINREWFHPDDTFFTCTSSAFNTAGIESTELERDGESVVRRGTAVISHEHLNPVPVDESLIYTYGTLVLALREKKKTLHTDTTRFELMSAVVAKHYNAVLATCFPERYKGVLRGLEIAHYRPGIIDWRQDP
ncbi:hypothetical protein [Demequina sediminicola]|uniref:hypothetical protein n=1 Tax=Demequina sediminicola TaxID=1095026 RepID=UPI000783FA0F|nr:hypothetical protein [Demequina sediminicola]